jgi:hypothetical protein
MDIFLVSARAWLRYEDGLGKDARAAVTILHAAALLKAPKCYLLEGLMEAVARLGPGMTPTEAASCLLDLETLGVADANCGALGPLTAAARLNARQLTALLLNHNCSLRTRQTRLEMNILHNAGAVQAFHHSILCNSCGAMPKDADSMPIFLLNAEGWLLFKDGSFGKDANACFTVLRAAANLKLSNQSPNQTLDELAVKIGAAAAHFSRDMTSIMVANSLRHLATLGVRDNAVIGPMLRAALAVSGKMNSQELHIALRALSVIRKSDSGGLLTSVKQLESELLRLSQEAPRDKRGQEGRGSRAE